MKNFFRATFSQCLVECRLKRSINVRKLIELIRSVNQKLKLLTELTAKNCGFPLTVSSTATMQSPQPPSKHIFLVLLSCRVSLRQLFSVVVGSTSSALTESGENKNDQSNRVITSFYLFFNARVLRSVVSSDRLG